MSNPDKARAADLLLDACREMPRLSEGKGEFRNARARGVLNHLAIQLEFLLQDWCFQCREVEV